MYRIYECRDSNTSNFTPMMTAVNLKLVTDYKYFFNAQIIKIQLKGCDKKFTKYSYRCEIDSIDWSELN